MNRVLLAMLILACGCAASPMPPGASAEYPKHGRRDGRRATPKQAPADYTFTLDDEGTPATPQAVAKQEPEPVCPGIPATYDKLHEDGTILYCLVDAVPPCIALKPGDPAAADKYSKWYAKLSGGSVRFNIKKGDEDPRCNTFKFGAGTPSTQQPANPAAAPGSAPQPR